MLLTTGDIKVNLQLQEDQLEYAKVYKEEEPEKCEYCINKIAGLQNSVNTLNEKIISASYWYGLQGNYPTHTKNLREGRGILGRLKRHYHQKEHKVHLVYRPQIHLG